MALKLDMSKAYDRVEWSFLEKIMLKMGFQDSWVALIMQYVSTVTYSILLNGEPKGFIRPSRGLRQSDPLSPFPFLFCAEGLNALLNKAVDNGEISCLSLCRQGPKITHLFLQMIAFYFVGQIEQNVKKFSNYLIGTRLLLASW